VEDAAHVHALDLSNEIAGVHIVYIYIYTRTLDLSNEIAGVHIVYIYIYTHALDLSNEIASVDGIGSGFRLRV
jgi:hypothetical protein